MRDTRAREAEDQRDNAQTEVMYLKSDKTRLAEELEAARSWPLDAYRRGQELWKLSGHDQVQVWHARAVAMADAEYADVTVKDMAAILSLEGFSRMTDLMSHDFAVYTYGHYPEGTPPPEFKWRTEFAPIEKRDKRS